MKWITAEMIIKRVSEIGNWRGYLDESNGTLEWCNGGDGVSIYATPNWDVEGEVPFDANVDSDEFLGYHNVCTIKMVEGDISTQLTHYLNVLIMVMNHYSRPKS